MKKNLLLILFLMIGNLSLAQKNPCRIIFEPMVVPQPQNNNADKFEIHVSITKADNSKVYFEFDYDGRNEQIEYYFDDLPIKIHFRTYKGNKSQGKGEEFDPEEDEEESYFDDIAFYRYSKLTNGYLRAYLKYSIQTMNFRNVNNKDVLCYNDTIKLAWNLGGFKYGIFREGKKDYFIKDSKIYADLKANKLIYSESDYYKNLVLQLKSDPITNIIDGSSVVLTSSVTLPPIYPNADLEKNGKIEVEEGILKVPSLKSSQKITLNSIFGGQFKDIKEDFLLGNLYGQYSLFLEDNDHCPVSKTLIYPELEYNYVNNPNDDVSALRSGIGDFVEHYNVSRPHQTLGYDKPIEWYTKAA